MKLYERIRVARKNANLTQYELGHIIGVNNITVYRWEKDSFTPKRCELEAIARATKVDMNWLINNDGGPGIPMLQMPGEITEKNIAFKLKVAINQAGLTQKKFAQLVGLSENTIVKYVSGKTIPHLLFLNRFAEVVGKPISFFINESSITNVDYTKQTHLKKRIVSCPKCKKESLVRNWIDLKYRYCPYCSKSLEDALTLIIKKATKE